MSGKIMECTKTQNYRLDFGTDGKLYTVTFTGNIPQAELKKLLSALKNCLYEKMPEAILLYLKQRHLEYASYNSTEIPLGKERVFGWADHLPNAKTYEKVDRNLENADFYYAVMDCQKSTQTYNMGCYFAVTRKSLGNGAFQHNVIAQSFLS